MFSIYVLGIVVAILSGLLLKSTLFRGNPVPFVMELPAYRIPAAKSVLLHMWEKARILSASLYRDFHGGHCHLVPAKL